MEANLDQKAKWDAVEDAIARSVSASPEPFAPATVMNAADFVRACRARCPIPEGVAKGYWSTIRIWWRGVEVEVFDDRYELYRLTQGDTRIEHFGRVPGEELPQGLVSQLPEDKPPEG